MLGGDAGYRNVQPNVIALTHRAVTMAWNQRSLGANRQAPTKVSQIATSPLGPLAVELQTPLHTVILALKQPQSAVALAEIAIGGGILGTVLLVLLIVWLVRRV